MLADQSDNSTITKPGSAVGGGQSVKFHITSGHQMEPKRRQRDCTPDSLVARCVMAAGTRSIDRDFAVSIAPARRVERAS